METLTAVRRLKTTRNTVVKHFPKGMRIAEVGVYRGDYSKRIVLAEPSELHLIDIWKHIDDGGIYSTLDKCNVNDAKQLKNMQKVQAMFEGNSAVRVIQGDGVEVSKRYPDGYFDCVYIDADHTFEGCLKDMRAYAPKITEDGFMFGHDFTNCYAHIQVPQAVQAFVEENPEWQLYCITAEPFEKTPSWFIVKENSRIKDTLNSLL